MTRRDLEDERSLLLRSLEDLDREHEAGDLSDEDHARLRDGYIARAAVVLRSLDGGPPAPDGPTGGAGPTRRAHGAATSRTAKGTHAPVRRHRMLIMAGLAAAIVCAVWGVLADVSSRLPGQSATGSISLSASEQTARTLAQAQTLEGRGDAVGAVELYETVLRQDPTDEEALAEVGWLEYEAGVQGKKATLLSLGWRQENRAESVDPGAFAPHLYLGSMLLTGGDPAGAVAQYRMFLADRPPPSTVAEAVPFLTKAFSEDHQALPVLPAGSPATG